MGEKITVYNHHAIVSEFKAMGLDIFNLPTKITFVCTRVLFCYTFAGARYRPHGMITVIAARLLEQFFNAMKVSVHWIRGHQPELPLMGSNLPQTFLNPESAEFKRIFSSMRLEPRRLYTLLKKRMKYDNGRKAYIWHGGWSTQDHKRKEEWTAANKPCSTPKLNGEKDDDIYKQLGSVADCIQDYLDLYCRVEGRAPNNDPARYDVFGKKLQKKMRAQRWRVDAINVTYERIGTLDEIKSLARDNGWCDVDINRRHKDKKDEIDPFYEHTCVFSCFFTQLNEVWRLSIIAFGRACLTSSTKRVLNREYFRKVLIDYLEDYNGGLEYIDFNLSDQLPYFVTNDCYRKLRQCNGSEESSDNVIPLDWAEDNQKYPGFRYVQLAEFMNRCGYSSSFASAIVQLSTQHGGLPRDKVVELILIAMKGCGSRNFCYVLTVLWKNIQKQ
jgi:hypothetical protein